MKNEDMFSPLLKSVNIRKIKPNETNAKRLAGDLDTAVRLGQIDDGRNLSAEPPHSSR